jgi:chemotaxis protein methyltransferase CheR
MTTITADEFSVLSKYIYSICGVALDTTKTYLVETRLKSMLQHYGCVSYMDLHSKAKADRSGNMEKEIINAITTNETLFFRDASPFEVFKHKILPDLIDARSKSSGGRSIPLRIWSAACSTGQEVYSIAIALREALGNLGNFQISILGTDISDEAVTKASYGKYNKFEIERGLPLQTLNRYFTLMGDGWKIKDEIRAMAVFKKFNLMKPFAGLGKFDIVFCRNVAIYFTPADKKAVFEKIASVLEPDGSLVIGSTESLTGVTGMFEPKRYMRSIFYQPVAGATPLTPAAFSFASGPGLAAGAAAPPPARASLSVPRPAPVAAPAVPPRPTAPSPAAPRPAAPSLAAPSPVVPSPASRPAPTPGPQPSAPPARPVEPELDTVTAEPPLSREETARPASFRPAPPRVQPSQVYRAGDKSDLKRLLMLKKQKSPT